MEIKIIDSIDKLLFYKAEWESILKEIDNNILFLELDWILFWWRIFGHKHKLFVLIVFNGKEIAGICPLMITKKIFYSEINFIGDRESIKNEFMLKDKYREEALKCICNFLRGLKGKNITRLHGLIGKSVNCWLLEEHLKVNNVPYITRSIGAYYLNIKDSNFNVYFESRYGKETRYKMNKKEKKLKNLGNLAYKRISASEIDDIFDIHEKRWLRKIGNSSFSKGETKEFYKGLVLNDNMNFKTTIDAIILNNKIISFLYGYVYNGINLLLRVAHDDDFYLLSPGELIFKKKIEDCFSLQTKVLEFGPGYEPYKARWTDDCYDLLTFVLPSNNLQSVVIFYIKYWIKIKLINALKNNKAFENLRKYYLGKVKYLISRESISYRITRIKRAVERDGLLSAIQRSLTGFINKIYSYRQHLILEKQLEGLEIYQTNMQVREASIGDLNALAEAMNEQPSNIVRRFINSHKCYITLCNDEIIHYCWIDYSISRFKISLEKYEAHIYDAFMGKKYKNEYYYTYIFSNIFSLLYKHNYRKCYITIDNSSKTFENQIYNKLFNPRYKILEKKVLSRIYHNIFDLKVNDKS